MRTQLIVLGLLLLDPAAGSGQAPPPRGSVRANPKAVAPDPVGLPKADESVDDGGFNPFIDLTNRYRFFETYTNREEQTRPGVIGQYQVAIKEVLKDSVETPDGPSAPAEITRQTIFTERPAEVSSLGAVTATVRNYSRFLVRPDDVVKTPGPRPLDGLTIWYRPRINEPPQILSLSEDRRLREREYEVAARQVFLPNLVNVFPNYPVRVGDSWRVPRKAVQAMLGESEIRGDSLLGKFAELRRDADGKTAQAVIAVVGRIANSLADTVINARILFTFPTSIAGKPADATAPGLFGAPARKVDETLVEARGAITELRLARVAAGILPGSTIKDQRYRAVQELVLERKLGVSSTNGALLKLFDAPAPTDVNTWLTYVDPQNRFVFHHPQDLVPPDRYQFSVKLGLDSILLVKSRPEGKDFVRVEIFAKEQTPETLKDVLNAQWKQMKSEVLAGEETWLPAVDWPNMKVFHIEAALKLATRGPRGSRVHYDAYLVQLGKDSSLMVIATTTRDAVAPFRRDIEQMIKTFRLGPSGAY